MDKGGAGLVMPDYAMTIQKSIVDSTVDSTKKEESDFDKSCHSEINLVIPNAARNLPEHMSRQPVGPREGFLLNPDSSLRSE
jgi:hypothetical protein